MFERFTDRARRVVVLSQDEARQMQHERIGTGHLLLGLLAEQQGIAARALTQVGFTLEDTRQAVAAVIKTPPGEPPEHMQLTNTSRKSLDVGLREALKLGSNYIGTEHILLGLLREKRGVAFRVLQQTGMADALLSVVTKLATAEPAGQRVGVMAGQQPSYQHPSRRGKTILDVCGENLTVLAAQGRYDPLIGRDSTVEQMIAVLGRRRKNNPVLVGEPGVGKTAVVEGLAQRIAAQTVPEMLLGKQVYALDLGTITAGTRMRGDFEERLKKIIAQTRKQGDVLLFCDEIHTLVGAGSASGSVDAASLLKPLLGRGELQTIGATTPDEYRKHFEKDMALVRRFQPVPVSEPTVSDTVEILMGLKDRYEQHHAVKYTDRAIVSAVRLADRYVADRHLPDKAIDVMDEAGAHLNVRPEADSDSVSVLERLQRVRQAKQTATDQASFEDLTTREERLVDQLADGSDRTVTEQTMAAVVAEWTGVPVQQLTEQQTERLLRMEQHLSERIVGQTEAVEAVSKAVRRSRAGLGDRNRPVGSFLFVGPSGVGKTETARALAEFLFGAENALIQLDMSEYMEKHSVSRLVGAPPGYVGFDQGGQLTGQVRQRPFSVVLFDEIEKAHPDVVNMLLQVLDEGRLTDSTGRSVSFRNALVVMTSNEGTEQLGRQPPGFRTAASDHRSDSRLRAALRKRFSPEFLNRIDNTVVFDALTVDEVEQIATRMVSEVNDRLAARMVGLVVAPSALRWLAETGSDTEHGARLLRRTVQHHVEDHLSEQLLTGHVRSGCRVLATHVLGENVLTWEVFSAQPAEVVG